MFDTPNLIMFFSSFAVFSLMISGTALITFSICSLVMVIFLSVSLASVSGSLVLDSGSMSLVSESGSLSVV